MAVEKVESISPHYEEDVFGWPFTWWQKRAIKAEEKKVTRQMITQRDEVEPEIKI